MKPTRYEKANVTDAMLLMRLWHRDNFEQHDWELIEKLTGSTDFSSRILWDYIRDALRNSGYKVEREAE